MSRKIYNHHDTGCQADGSFGHDHVRCVMASIFGAAFGKDTFGTTASEWDEGRQELFNSLLGPMPDDCWDEEAFLSEILKRCDGVCFTLHDGDLMCVTDEKFVS